MLPHDLLEAEETRSVLNMPPAKFELRVSSGQLLIFRCSGRNCSRREDIEAIPSKRQAAQAKAATPSDKPRAPQPG